MAMQYLERELRKLKETDLAEDIALKKKQFARRGHGSDIPLQTQEQKPSRVAKQAVEEPKAVELDLDAEWQRQAQNYLSLGFHKEAGFEETAEGKQAFLDSLPKFEPQPEEYRGKFDMPLLVIKKIPWERQAELAGISISDYLQSMLDKTHE